MTAPPEDNQAGAARDGDATPSDDQAAPPPPTRMLKNEQQFGYLLAAALAAFSLAAQLPSAVRGDGKASALAAVGVGIGVLLAAAVRYGQRIITSFTAVAGGFAPLGKSYVGVSFVCLLYGAW